MVEFLNSLMTFVNSYDLKRFFKQDDQMIHHYTTLDTFMTIIKKNELRFSDRFYLNDKTEGVYVLDLCIKNKDQFCFSSNRIEKMFYRICNERLKYPQADNFYVYQLSFSKDSDSLTMWNYYGLSGLNLSFNNTMLSKSLKPECVEGKPEPTLLHGEIIYDEGIQIKTIKTIVDDFNSFFEGCNDDDLDKYDYFCASSLVNKMMYAGVFMKKKCFEAEKEYRCAFELGLKESDKGTPEYYLIKNKQKFFTRKGLIVPCVDIKFCVPALERITVAPILDFETARNNILRVNGGKFPKITKDTIFKSEIPVRF